MMLRNGLFAGSFAIASIGFAETHPQFKKFTLDEKTNRPAFIETADLDNDGRKRFLFPCSVILQQDRLHCGYKNNGSIDSWTKKKVSGSDTDYNVVKVTMSMVMGEKISSPWWICLYISFWQLRKYRLVLRT